MDAKKKQKSRKSSFKTDKKKKNAKPLQEEFLQKANVKVESVTTSSAKVEHPVESQKDIELLKSAKHLGPLYSSSSVSNTVAVTSSINSSQLSTDRLQNLHLYGGSVFLSVGSCEKSSCSNTDIVKPVCESSLKESLTSETASSGSKMTPPAEKTREEVEEERKARKAAKLAAKNKAKIKHVSENVGNVVLPESVKSNSDQSSKPPPAEKTKEEVEEERKAAKLAVKIKVKVNHASENVGNVVLPESVKSNSDQSSKPPPAEKTREEVEEERKARKAAKLATKNMAKIKHASENVGNVVLPESAKSNSDQSSNKPSTAAPSAQNREGYDEPDRALPSPVIQQTHFHAENILDSKMKNLKIKETPDEMPAKSKSELRAERRAKQEAQRAAKAEQKAKPKEEKPQAAEKQPSKVALPVKSPKSQVVRDVKSTRPTDRRVKLFSHLYQHSFGSISQLVGVNNQAHHPAIVRLGVQYAERVIRGSNARCVALLYALKEVIRDYVTPLQKEFVRALEGSLQPDVEFLQQCRPLSVSMHNALKHIKRQMTAMPNNISESKARQDLIKAIDTYIKDQIELAAQAIGEDVSKKISDSDVILVYSCSSLVLHALSVAHNKGREFRVVVVDSLPWLEGREMLRRLVSIGIKCSYVHISAASFVMREVSKVLLGAHALLANGYVMSRVGSSQVALLARSYNVPVLVCCETHKFSERVQTDSFVYNELGNPDDIVNIWKSGEGERQSESPLRGWRDVPSLSILNLTYDVTPPDLVTAVVTELAILPCTSVPVILRIRPSEC